MTQRWMAHTTRGYLAHVLVAIVPLAALAILFRVVESHGFSFGVVVALVVVVPAAALGLWWALRRRARKVAVTIDGGHLDIAGYGRHALAPGSLHALRARESPLSQATLGTHLFVKLEGGRTLLFLIPSIVSDDRYAGDDAVSADLIFEHDASVLLAKLEPYVMPRDPSAPRPDVPTYAIPLRPNTLLSGDITRVLHIAGDTIALGGEGPALVATARAREMTASPYGFTRAESLDSPSFPVAPAIALRFPAGGIALTIGAHPISLESHWHHLPSGSSPEYLVGYGELMKLMDVLSR